jgi:hypothetical protein
MAWAILVLTNNNKDNITASKEKLGRSRKDVIISLPGAVLASGLLYPACPNPEPWHPLTRSVRNRTWENTCTMSMQ